jgi:MoaA/NifB/PqqE/SkfB family radical SAM enzyme
LTEYGTSLYWIALSGGEISLYKDINELILIFSKYCPNLTLITFTTNGLLPNQILSIGLEIKEKLPRCDFFVTISLDGDESLHDNIRGVPGNFKLANETLELLTKNKIKSHFGLTLSQLNMHHFKDDISLLQFNPKAISLVHDEGIYQTKLQFDNLELQGIIKQLIINYKIIHLGELIEYFFLKIAQKFLENNRKKNIIPCEVINTSLHLTPYGDVKPCMYLPSLGNIKNKSILNILHSKETNDSLQEIKKNHCPKCWMNCYAPHSMMLHPIKTIQEVLWK